MAETLDNKKYVCDRLMATGRENMDSLIAYMDKVGFFTAPCSSQYHLCCEFGLVQHTRNVMTAAEDIAYALYGKKYKDSKEMQDSVAISAALHDLGKCGDFGKPLYKANILKSGKISDAKPYERSKDLSPVPHGYRSVILAERYIDLTEEEEFAIMYHDGFFEPSNAPVLRSADFSQYPLLLIIHAADIWSANVTEVKKEEKK